VERREHFAKAASGERSQRDAGCGMRDAGYRMRDAGYRMRDAGCRMKEIT